MAPGSIVNGVMYKKIGKIYKNTLSPIAITKDEFIAKLMKVDLVLGTLNYKKYDVRNGEVNILYDRSKGILLNSLKYAREEGRAVKFISLLHGSSSGKPNTLLNSNGIVRCWKC